MSESQTKLKTTWSGGAQGEGVIEAGHLKTNIAIPESLGGSGNGSEPQEMLIASAATCLTMTLTGMLEGRKLPVQDIKINTESNVSEETGIEITHHVQVILNNDATDKQIQSADKAIEIADDRCNVGNLLRKAGIQIIVQKEVSKA